MISEMNNEYELRKSMSRKRSHGRFGFLNKSISYKRTGVYLPQYERMVYLNFDGVASRLIREQEAEHAAAKVHDVKSKADRKRVLKSDKESAEISP